MHYALSFLKCFCKNFLTKSSLMFILSVEIETRNTRSKRALICLHIFHDMSKLKNSVQVMRFFTNPHKPVILALSRPDPKKNLTTLLKAFGESRPLRELANLVSLLDSTFPLSGNYSLICTRRTNIFSNRCS